MQVICGVDISKARLDVFVEREGDVVAAFANDTLGISALADFCTQHGVTLVVMEASGGFERLSYGLCHFVTSPPRGRGYSLKPTSGVG